MCKTVQNKQQKRKKIDDDRNSFALFTISKHSKETVLCTVRITIQLERP